VGGRSINQGLCKENEAQGLTNGGKMKTLPKKKMGKGRGGFDEGKNTTARGKTEPSF